jgi:hypothetical protein
VEQSVERTQRTYIKLFLGGLVGLFLFIVLCWGGCRAYSVFESQHLTRRGTAYLGAGDLRQAALSGRRALQLNPGNIAAIRLVARVAESSGDKSALDWRRKALELQPKSAEDAIALSNSALQFNDKALAEKTLQGIDESERNTAEFHAAAARLAEAQKKFPEAENHWSKAVELAANNGGYRLQFALALLRMGDAQKREKALSLLQELRADEKQRAAATRALIMDGAMQHWPGDKLLVLCQELIGYPGATFSDRLLYLDILRQSRDPKFIEYLTNVEKEVSTKPADLAALLSWMKANGMSLLAIDFARTLPKDQVNKWPVSLALTEAYTKLADWSLLEDAIKNQNWGQYELLRHAYLAMALRNMDKRAASDREWTTAQKDADTKVETLTALSRAASEWGWKDEANEVLWNLSKQPEAQAETLETLYQRYLADGDTPGLYRVLTKFAELRPQDMAIQNNLAQVGLLLDVDRGRISRLAEEAYNKDRSNPAFAATYAFALYTRGDASGAVRVMNAFNETQLMDPPIAAYYGVMLAAAGDATKAKQYLAAGETAKLLPEEKALITKAQRTLSPANP